MDISEAVSVYIAEDPAEKSALHHISLALRRNHITTLEQLHRIYGEEPERLKLCRDIGPKRLTVIGEMLRYYEMVVRL